MSGVFDKVVESNSVTSFSFIDDDLGFVASGSSMVRSLGGRFRW